MFVDKKEEKKPQQNHTQTHTHYFPQPSTIILCLLLDMLEA